MTDTEWKEGLARKHTEVFGKNVFEEKELTKEFYTELRIGCADFFQTEDGGFDQELFWSDSLKAWLMEKKPGKRGSFEELCERIRQFNKERDWDQFHTPSNIAKSIAIEAGELLECFQWSDENYDREAVLEELADVSNYCIQMSQALGVDLLEVMGRKIDKNEQKYPVEKAKGVSTKYDKL